jgi:predicted  nucleic acid-binding Zn-ribbon protein
VFPTTGSPEDFLHHRLAQAAADMVIPLETFFACGVELNLKTASLTQDLLEKFPESDREILLDLQGNLSPVAMASLAKASGRSVAELTGLRQRFQAAAATALLPKIKAGLGNVPEPTPNASVTPSGKPSGFTERLTLSTESEQVARWRKLHEAAQDEVTRLTATHVPKSRLDSLQAEYAQQRQLQATLAETIGRLQGELSQARSEVAALPAQELADLRTQVTAQQHTARQLESNLTGMQMALTEASSAANEVVQLQSALAQAQTQEAALQTRLGAAETKVSELSARTKEQTAAAAEVARLEQAIATHESALEAARAATPAAVAEELASLQARLAEAEERAARLSATSQSLAASESEMARLHNAISEHESALQLARETTPAAVAEELASLEARLAEAEANVARLSESNGACRRRLPSANPP